MAKTIYKNWDNNRLYTLTQIVGNCVTLHDEIDTEKFFVTDKENFKKNFSVVVSDDED